MDRQTPSAGALLRRARQQAGLSQPELARKANVTQSVVSAYESGRREPSLRTLERLVRATGFELVIDLERRDDSVRGLPDTPVGRRLRRLRKRVIDIAARHGASSVRVFGSVARGEDTATSDIDIVAEFAPGTGLFEIVALQQELEKLLGHAVDLVPSEGLRSGVNDEVEREAVYL